MSKFYMMIGLPGSGKSYEAKKIAEREDAVIVSSDEIRKEIYGDAACQENADKVFQIAHQRIKDALTSGQSVILDATNISYKRRMALLSEIKKYASEKIAVFMATPFELCVARQSLRERRVSENVITRMYHNFSVPYFYEGWDKVEVVYPAEVSKYETNHIEELLAGTSEMYRFDQKNPHHTATLGEHMRRCYEGVCCKTENMVLKEAALLHDIGKVKAQSFDENGEAHYFQHHCVSGYDSMFEVGECTDINDKLLRAAYVQWHMGPYRWIEEKTQKRYKNLLGEDFYNNLLMLHEADMAAH